MFRNSKSDSTRAHAFTFKYRMSLTLRRSACVCAAGGIGAPLNDHMDPGFAITARVQATIELLS